MQVGIKEQENKREALFRIREQGVSYAKATMVKPDQ